MVICDKSKNIIQTDGQLISRGTILNELESEKYFNELLATLNWKSDKLKMFGKEIITKRKTAWYATKKLEYKYSGQTKVAQLFTPALLELKKLVEIHTSQKYNACLLNLYHNGLEGMSWHTDNEKEITKNSSIASISLGSERFFDVKHNSKELKERLLLSNGSLIEMKAPFQDYWKHQIPIQRKIKTPRISLTFRLMT